MSKRPFPVDPHLTAIAIGFRNGAMIADQVLPRVIVGKSEFKYWKYDPAEQLTVPDTRVGRRGRVNEVSFSATEVTDSTDDFGLEDPIPQSDIDDAPANHDVKGQATEGIANLIILDREVRTANVVFNPATYPAANKEALAGTDQFSDFANSDPLGVLSDALDAPLMRPNIMVIGRPAWSVLARHPQIVKAVHGNSGDAGIVARRAVADLLELEDVIVGESRVNTARKGQPANYQMCWGKHIALIHRDKNATNRQGATFGFTAQSGTRQAGSWEDKNIGLYGGQRVRVGESVKEVISAASFAYFIEDAVA